MTTLVEAPARVLGVQLIGEMAGSGYRSPPALVRRADGQTLQLTRLLYLVLHAVDGRRSYADIAALVGRALDRHLSGDDVRALVDDHLRPVGLVRLADGTEPALRRSNPLLSLSMKFAITNPRTTRLLTSPFRFLFRPLVATGVVLGFLLITWWVFFEQGLAASAYDAFQRPHLLLLVFVVSVLSGGFHEFGHAAAARYGGAEPGVMGGGLYLVWPAFYTDVTDSYRLGRGGRIRTDLGGLHFNALVVVLTFVWWYATGWQALLLLVATQTMQMVHQLLPLLRFDGYHLLADITGVPDLYHRIRPTLRGLLPQHWLDPENRVLKPWARAVITLWVLVTIPMMALMLAAVVAAVPRLLGTAAAFVRDDAAGVTGSWGNGSLVDASAHVVQVLLVVLPMLACILILGRVGLRWFRGMASWSRGSVPKRVAAACLSAALVTGLSWAWWPDPGTYRPIGPDDRGTLTALLPSDAEPAAAGLPAPPIALAADQTAQRSLLGDQPLRATFASTDSVPTRAHPQLAVVLVPAVDGDQTGTATGDTGPAAEQPGGDGALPSDDDADPWVFPFDKPLPPEQGDNQAIAVNTSDDSVTYDVAFAMVWADGDEVLNVNEAHAYASCSRCVTVAVAYQIVLIMDDAQVVVPQNLAVAANYDCYRCITAAVASQLVLTVEEAPGEEQLLELRAVWDRLLEFGRTITSYPLAEITAQLEAFKVEIVQILASAPTVTSSESASTPTSDESSTSSPTPTTSPSESTTSSTTSPTPTAGTSDPTDSPTTESTDEPTTTSPSPSTSPSDTTSPTSTEVTPTPTASASP